MITIQWNTRYTRGRVYCHDRESGKFWIWKTGLKQDILNVTLWYREKPRLALKNDKINAHCSTSSFHHENRENNGRECSEHLMITVYIYPRLSYTSNQTMNLINELNRNRLNTRLKMKLYVNNSTLRSIKIDFKKGNGIPFLLQWW